MTSERDLSAFQPPSRAVLVAPPPPTPAIPTSVTGPAPAWDDGDAPRRKVMTSVPAQLHRRLREVAEGEGRFKGDLVVEALRIHGPGLTRPHVRPSRRRARVEDATQCQLYLTDTEREEIDDLAQRLGLSRSGLVTLLLERCLAPVVN